MMMNTEPTAARKDADPAPEPSDPILSDRVRRHLGALLVDVYAEESIELDTTAPFAELIAKLDIALGQERGRGDAEFRQLLLAVTPALRRFALSLAREPAAADDLVQDTFLKAWKNRAGFEMGTNFEAWTFTILRNQFYSLHRRRNWEVQDSDGFHAEKLTSLPTQAGRLDIQDVQAALAQLNPLMREALMLVTVEGLSYEDAATVMDCQLGTVKSRVSRGRDQLARLLGYDGDEIGNDPMMLSAQVNLKKTSI